MKPSNEVREIVVYDNTFNKTNLTFLTQAQSHVLMAVLSKMGDNIDDEGRFVSDYTFKEIRRMTGMKELYASRLSKILNELLKTKVEFFEDGKTHNGNLFLNCIANNKSSVKITLSIDMTKKLLLNKNGYTILELNEYMALKSKYAKELYRLLRQFRHTGKLMIKKEDFLKMLLPPKTYDEYEFIRKILITAIEENKKHFKNLKMTNFTKNGNGLPSACIFTFEKHEREKDKKEKSTDKNLGNYSDEEIDLIKYIMENGGI